MLQTKHYVPIAHNEHHDTLDSADVCQRPAGKNNTGTPYMTWDRSNGHLLWPAVHQSMLQDYPRPKGLGVR